jgi:hypothetical protein
MRGSTISAAQMVAEISMVELNSIKDMEAGYRNAWAKGVADAFVLMGGNFLMEEWKPDRGAMH